MEKAVFFAIALAAGIAVALQGAANAGLSARIGLGAALLVNTLIVLLGAAIIYLVQGAPTPLFPRDVPWSLYLGGVFGLVIIAAMAFVFPKIGAATAIGLLVLAQGGAALVVDHFGLLGMPSDPVTLTRAAGLVLLGGGVVLMR